jgi:hypothetical protein
MIESKYFLSYILKIKFKRRYEKSSLSKRLVFQTKIFPCNPLGVRFGSQSRVMAHFPNASQQIKLSRNLEAPK